VLPAVGPPRQLVVQRCRRADVDIVQRTTERCGVRELVRCRGHCVRLSPATSRVRSGT
jgi:hypothetical protein